MIDHTMATGPIQVVGLVGSLRSGSYNRLLMELAQEVAPPQMTIQIVELGDLPLYNSDLERDDLPASVWTLHEHLRDADALLIATPEYNHGIPGVLKNALDWASRSLEQDTSPLAGKPTAIMGAAPGMWGTIRAQKHLRSILAATNTPVVLKPEILVSGVKKQIEDGRITNENTSRFVRQLLDNLVELTWRYEHSYPASEKVMA